MFIQAKDDGSGGDNCVNGAISRAKLQSNHYHQQTNIQFFLQAGCPSCRPTTSVKALKGNITFHGLAYPKLTWGLPTLSLTTSCFPFSSWLPWGRVAMPLISRLMPVPIHKRIWRLLMLNFYRYDAHPVAQPTVSKHLGGKISSGGVCVKYFSNI